MILQIIQIKLVDEWKLPIKNTIDDFLHFLHISAHLISNLYAPCDTIFEEHFIYTLIKHESAWNRDSKVGTAREGESERERMKERDPHRDQKMKWREMKRQIDKQIECCILR